MHDPRRRRRKLGGGGCGVHFQPTLQPFMYLYLGCIKKVSSPTLAWIVSSPGLWSVFCSQVPDVEPTSDGRPEVIPQFFGIVGDAHAELEVARVAEEGVEPGRQ